MSERTKTHDSLLVEQKRGVAPRLVPPSDDAPTSPGLGCAPEVDLNTILMCLYDIVTRHMPTCRACRRGLPPDAKFCGFCGFRLAPLPTPSGGKPRAAQTVIRLTPEEALAKVDDEELAAAETVRAALPVQDDPHPTAPVTLDRQFQRFPMRVDVTLSSGHNFYAASTENISRGGLFIATAQPAAVGHVLEITFTLPGMDFPRCVLVEVKWVRSPATAGSGPPGMGVRFLSLDGDTEAAIESFIVHREPIFLSAPGPFGRK